MIKAGYLLIFIGGITLALLSAVLAFFYAISGILLLLYVQVRVLQNSQDKKFVTTINEFKALDSNLKNQTYAGFFIISSSLIGLLIKIGILLLAL